MAKESKASRAAADAAAADDEAAANATAATPSLGVDVKDLADGTTTVEAVGPDGTQHSMTLPSNSGALISFKDMVVAWFDRLGERATTWDKSEPTATDHPAAKEQGQDLGYAATDQQASDQMPRRDEEPPQTSSKTATVAVTGPEVARG